MEKKFTTALVQENEVVKAEDINYNFNAQVDNLSIFAKALLEPDKDFIINGKVYSLGGMNLGIKPFLASHNSSGVCFISTSDITEGISVEAASTSPRIDILQIKPKEIEFDEQSRAFLDFDTKIETIQNVFTKKRIGVDIVVKKGTAGSSVAPLTDDGYLKIAEIYVPANATLLTDDNIKNISSDLKNIENQDWTNEKDKIYNINYLSTVNTRFRAEHEKDGTHKAKIIGKNELDIGSGLNQVNGTMIPIGEKIELNGAVSDANTSIKSFLVMLAGKIATIFNSYINNGGAYNFKGDVKISSVLGTNNILTNALVISADGQGTATLKIGDKTILTLANNVIRLPNGYSATQSNDVVTKSVTDAISLTITEIQNDIEEINKTISSNAEWTNNLFARYSFAQISITVATTTNINLSGVQTIDGVAVAANNIVLVKNQTDKKKNGIYIVQTGAWDRHTSFNSENTLKHKLFLVLNGSINKGKVFYIPSESFTVGTDEISFSESIFTANTSAYTIPIRDASGKIQSSNPENNNDAATKGYVDSSFARRYIITGSQGGVIYIRITQQIYTEMITSCYSTKILFTSGLENNDNATCIPLHYNGYGIQGWYSTSYKSTTRPKTLYLKISDFADVEIIASNPLIIERSTTDYLSTDFPGTGYKPIPKLTKQLTDNLFSDAKDLTTATGVLPVSKGGTGKTTTKAAQNALLSDMKTEDYAPSDDSFFVMKYISPSDTNGAVYARKVSYAWEWIKSKISSVLGLTSTSYSGNSATATKLATARTIKIQDSTGDNTGVGVSFDGSGDITLKLPTSAVFPYGVHVSNLYPANNINNNIGITEKGINIYTETDDMLKINGKKISELSVGSAKTADFAIDRVYNCNTAASTQYKILTIDGITELYDGLYLKVRFELGNTASEPVLVVNGISRSIAYNRRGSSNLYVEYGNYLYGAYRFKTNTVLELRYSTVVSKWIAINNPIVMEYSPGNKYGISYRVHLDGYKEVWGNLPYADSDEDSITVSFPVTFGSVDTYTITTDNETFIKAKTTSSFRFYSSNNNFHSFFAQGY